MVARAVMVAMVVAAEELAGPVERVATVVMAARRVAAADVVGWAEV